MYIHTLHTAFYTFHTLINKAIGAYYKIIQLFRLKERLQAVKRLVFTCLSVINAAWQRPASIKVLHPWGLTLPPVSPLSYIYLHPHHKRLRLLLGHSGEGQYYFCCVDHRPVRTYLYLCWEIELDLWTFPLKFVIWGFPSGVSGNCFCRAMTWESSEHARNLPDLPEYYLIKADFAGFMKVKRWRNILQILLWYSPPQNSFSIKFIYSILRAKQTKQVQVEGAWRPSWTHSMILYYIILW